MGVLASGARHIITVLSPLLGGLSHRSALRHEFSTALVHVAEQLTALMNPYRPQLRPPARNQAAEALSFLSSSFLSFFLSFFFFFFLFLSFFLYSLPSRPRVCGQRRRCPCGGTAAPQAPDAACRERCETSSAERRAARLTTANATISQIKSATVMVVVTSEHAINSTDCEREGDVKEGDQGG